MLKVARRGLVPPFIVMDVMRAAHQHAAAGNVVLHLEVGQPSTPAPTSVLRRAATALANERLGYTDALGLMALRQAIAAHYRRSYGIEIDWQRIAVTTGSSGGFILAFLAAFDAGARVGVLVPGYPAYRNILRALDVEVVPIPAGSEHSYGLDPGRLASLDEHLDGLIIASPANPTGTVLDANALAAMTGYCRSASIRLISDEIYHGITFGAGAETALASSDEVIVVNSFSKYYSMTGWRVGWLVLPESLIRPVECLAQNLFISPPALSQFAAIAAFDCRDELDANVARYARNRARLLADLIAAGLLGIAPSSGAFYLYVDVRDMSDDSEDFCRRLLADTGVAVTPGTDFDPERGRGFIRLSYAGAEAEVAEAGARISRWVTERRTGTGVSHPATTQSEA